MISRRDFLRTTPLGFGAIALAELLCFEGKVTAAEANPTSALRPHSHATARSVIFILDEVPAANKGSATMSETNSSTTTPPPQDVPTTQPPDVYRTALVRAFLFQVLFAVLASLMLDGGIFRRFFGGVSVLFWLGALVILMRRPGARGIWYLRYGVQIVFVLCLLAGSLLPDDTLLNLVTR